MRLCPETLFQLSLYGCRPLMNRVQGELSVHPNMHLDGYAVADAPSVQIVRLPDIIERLDNLKNLLLGLWGQGAVRQFSDTLLE